MIERGQIEAMARIFECSSWTVEDNSVKGNHVFGRSDKQEPVLTCAPGQEGTMEFMASLAVAFGRGELVWKT
jgi:hypothetical protein